MPRPAADRSRAPVAGTDACCAPKRVHFFEGRLLTADDLRDEQEYHRETRRRLVRALHGWGVVDGLRVGREAGDPNGIVVAPGTAIDPRGELLCVGLAQRLALPAQGTRLHVVLAYAEEPCDPAPSIASSGEGDSPFTRTRETFRLSLEAEPPGDAVVLARLVRRKADWRLDRTFRRRRLARPRSG